MAGMSYIFSNLKWKITQQLPYFIRYQIHLVARLKPYHMRTTLPLTVQLQDPRSRRESSSEAVYNQLLFLYNRSLLLDN